MKKDKTIIDRIKEGNIKQKPKWHFILEKAFIWICYILCILIGAASFSVILFSIQQTEFNILSHLSHSRIELFLGLLPFFWIITMLTFLFLSFFIFRKSTKGYKYQRIHLFTFNSLMSIGIGTLFYIAGGGHQLEHAFAERVPTYKSVQDTKIYTWMQPELGFLAGTIMEVKNDTIIVKDFNNTLWQVHVSQAFIAGRVEMKPDYSIKLIGRITKPNHFQATEIRPWTGRNSMPSTTPTN